MTSSETEDVLSIGDIVDCAISDIKPDGKINLTMKIKRKEAHKAKIEEVKLDREVGGRPSD